MRVLAAYYMDKPGGFCRRLYRLLNALVGRGHEVHYLTLKPPEGILHPLVQVHQMRLPLQSRSGVLFWGLYAITCAWQLASLARRVGAERLVAFGPVYALLMSVARYWCRLPLVLFVRSRLGATRGSGRVVAWIIGLTDRLGIRAASHIVAQTKVMAAQIEAILRGARRPISILPNDAPYAETQADSRPKPGAGYCALVSGVFTESKNLEFLREVFRLLEHELGDRSWRLIVLGVGSALEKFRASLAGASNIEIRGWVRDPRDLILESALVVHPSEHEGMPNAVLEAMSLGKPVLASDIPELRELLVHDELLFSPSDPRALAERLQRLSHQPEELQRLTMLVRKIAVTYRFNWDAKISETVESSR